MDKFNQLPDDYELVTPYINNSTTITVRHKKFGMELTRLPKYFLENPEFPHVDDTFEDKRNHDWYNTQVTNLGIGQYTVLDEYVNYNTKIRHKHDLCGYIYADTPKNFISGKRCPICNNYSFKGVSKDEKELVSFIKSLGIEVEENNRYAIDERHSYELDLFLPKYNIGIEFNGLIWHSDKYKEDNHYHYKKTTFFKSKGIRVIHILESEWIHTKDIVKSKLMEILGIKLTVNSSKFTVKTIDRKTARAFLLENHVKGIAITRDNIGLYNGKDLVSVMSLKLENNSINIRRFAQLYPTTNGFKKMISYIESNYKITNIYTNEDIRWSTENEQILLSEGFEVDGFIEPNYYYVYGNKTYKQYSFHKLKPGLTEDKYSRIWDCGRIIYRKKV